MGPSSDQIGRQITQKLSSMESNVVELRERTERKVRRTTRTVLIVAGAGAALGVAAVGALVVYRLTRPPTTRERVRRLLPSRFSRLRPPRLPRVRLSIGDPPETEERPEPRWERLAIRAARAAGTAAASALAPRLLHAVTESLRKRQP